MNAYRDAESTDATGDSETGGMPQTLGRCTVCGNAYPIRETEDNEYHPVGTDGTCDCGNDEFTLPSER